MYDMFLCYVVVVVCIIFVSIVLVLGGGFLGYGGVFMGVLKCVRVFVNARSYCAFCLFKNFLKIVCVCLYVL